MKLPQSAALAGALVGALAAAPAFAQINAGGLASHAPHRIEVHGASATPAGHWTPGFRVRDVAQAPDGALWLIERDEDGGLYRLSPK